MAYIVPPDACVPTRQVKNLGWLKRHAQDVERIEMRDPRTVFAPRGRENVRVIPLEEGETDASYSAGLLIAYLRDGTIYATYWADHTVALRWLGSSRIFRGVPLQWYGLGTYCGCETE